MDRLGFLVFRYLTQLRKQQLAWDFHCLCSRLSLRLVGSIKTLIKLKLLGGLFFLFAVGMQRVSFPSAWLTTFSLRVREMGFFFPKIINVKAHIFLTACSDSQIHRLTATEKKSTE